MGKKKNNISNSYIDSYIESDETFAFIAGYTECGFAYGVTWEEIGDKAGIHEIDRDDTKEDLPFD